MFNIDTSSTTISKPSPSIANAPGWFGPSGTTPSADWANAIQAELLNILSAANITPNKATTNQVITALKTLFAQNVQVVNPTPSTLNIGDAITYSNNAQGGGTGASELTVTNGQIYRITFYTSFTNPGDFFSLYPNSGHAEEYFNQFTSCFIEGTGITENVQANILLDGFSIQYNGIFAGFGWSQEWILDITNKTALITSSAFGAENCLSYIKWTTGTNWTQLGIRSVSYSGTIWRTIVERIA